MIVAARKLLSFPENGTSTCLCEIVRVKSTGFIGYPVHVPQNFDISTRDCGNSAQSSQFGTPLEQQARLETLDWRKIRRAMHVNCSFRRNVRFRESLLGRPPQPQEASVRRRVQSTASGSTRFSLKVFVDDRCMWILCSTEPEIMPALLSSADKLRWSA